MVVTQTIMPSVSEY